LADSLLATRLALFGEEAAEAARITLQEPLQQNRIAGWMSSFFYSVT
jgi:hypothetical protein